MKTTLVAIASAILVACAPAFAQNAAASASTADKATVEATQKMLATMRVRDTMSLAFRQMEQQMPNQIMASVGAAIRNDTKMNEQQKAEALQKLQQKMPELSARLHTLVSDPSLLDDMVREMVPVYAETYTLDEIRQLTAFYDSPIGQKMLAKMPQLMARSMEIGNRVMMPRMQKFMAENAQSLAGE